MQQTMFWSHFSRSRRKTTQKHVLRCQATEIGNLTSWPQITLTSEKFTSGQGGCWDMSQQTRIMSIHRLLIHLFSAFCGGKGLNGKVKHFVFDLTCDVTGDSELNFLTSSERCRPGLSIAGWVFPLCLLVTEIVWCAATPPPPQQGA